MATHVTRTNPSLPDEVIFVILSRLPVKSLLRFRTACKSWLSLISSREFIKTHISISNNDPHHVHHHLLIRHRSDRSNRSNFTTCSVYSLHNESFTESMVDDFSGQTFKLDHPGDIKCVIGCCNGLVCVRSITCKGVFLFLWNPSTRKSRRLPKLDYMKTMSTKFWLCYDESDDDFKVFAMFNHRLGYKCKVAVYSLKSDFWRMIGDFRIGGLLYDGGKFSNGAIHWVVKRLEPVKSKIILSFDIQTETFREVLLPNNEGGTVLLKFDTFGEKLIVLIGYENIRSDFWVLEEYGVEKGWKKLFTIPHDEIGFLAMREPMYMYPKPFCIFENGDVLLHVNSAIVVYSTEHNTYKGLLDFGFGALQCPYSAFAVTTMSRLRDDRDRD
ncbi:F-box/kelch-repeat protein At3g23880-like [Apium graveolens]|uniref:F-box/kelch-repeat protein At3g23880-like n=1 Tax=Apium graveolens TaxID=4045 RepID=UPI003D7998A1